MALTTPRLRGRDPFRKKSLEEFLINKPKTTAKTYRMGLLKYLNWVYGLERTVLTEGRVDMTYYNNLSLQYFTEYPTPDEHAALLADFIEETSTTHSPKALSTMKSTVIQFLATNKIFLPQELTRTIRTGNRAISVDRIPTREEIRSILAHTDLCGRAYILMLISSGMRPSEPLGLTWGDIDAERGIVHIPATITKTGVGRVTFLSKEAQEAFNTWKLYHPTFCDIVRRQSAGKTIPDENKVFPVTYGAMRNRFTLLLEKAGVTEADETGRRKIHLHGFRKYFRTNLAKAVHGNTIDIVEALMGHEGYLANSYVRLTIEDLEAFYRSAEQTLWIYKEPPINVDELRRVEIENERLKADAKRQQEDVDSMQRDIEMLISDHIAMKEKLAAWERGRDIDSAAWLEELLQNVKAPIPDTRI